MFATFEERNVSACNSILSLYLRAELLGLVIETFMLFRNTELLPNEFTFAIVLSACAKKGRAESGRKIHCHIAKMGFYSSSYCDGALIDMYAKCNSMNDAQTVFDEAVQLDPVSWTSMIAGYAKCGLPQVAIKMFEEMNNAGQEPDQVARVTVINALVVLGRLSAASDMFHMMPSHNAVAWNMMISAHTQRGCSVEAIQFFQKMKVAGVLPTRSTLGSMFRAIASLADLEFGMLVHAEAIKLGLDSNVYVGSSLVNMYAKCENLEASKRAFDSMDEQNSVLWNALLGGYAQNGYSNEVLNLFSNMKSSGFHPDDFTFTSVLNACSSLEYLHLGQQLHSAIIKSKLSFNLFVGNAMIDMYSKCHVIEDARKQFEIMADRDNISWNSIMVGYVQEEDEVEAFYMFQKMNYLGILPDEVSMSSILSACSYVEHLLLGKQVHCFLVLLGLEISLYAGSSLIGMYSKCGDMISAHKMFALVPIKNVVSMNALIAGYAQVDLDAAIGLFQEMQAEGLSASDITFATILDACRGPEKLDIGRQIHCLSLKKGSSHVSGDDDDHLAVPLIGMYMSSMRKADASLIFSQIPEPKSTILHTAMISGLAENNCSEEALWLFQEMHRSNAALDQATFVSILRACSLSSSSRYGRATHSLIFHTGFHLDELTCSSLIDMYAKCGCIHSSNLVFEEMSVRESIISWNSMIVGFAKNGLAEDALHVFVEMTRTHVRPDEVTFLGVLTACSHAGQVSRGRWIFDLMVNRYQIQPRPDHCACMVDLLGRWGLLTEADKFIDELNFEPDAMIWAAMLGACRIHGDDKKGERAARKLIELEPQNSSPYVLLSNIYAASGDWDKVNELRREMREKVVRKTPGFSWIAVGQEKRYFVSRGKASSLDDEIVNNFIEPMKDHGFAPSESFFHYE